MPVERAPIRMFAVGPAVLVQVGQQVDLREPLIAPVLVHDVDLNLPETPGEGHLSLRRQVDVAEQNCLVLEERLVDRRENVVARRLLDRQADDLAAERR